MHLSTITTIVFTGTGLCSLVTCRWRLCKSRINCSNISTFSTKAFLMWTSSLTQGDCFWNWWGLRLRDFLWQPRKIQSLQSCWKKIWQEDHDPKNFGKQTFEHTTSVQQRWCGKTTEPAWLCWVDIQSIAGAAGWRAELFRDSCVSPPGKDPWFDY